MAGTVVHPNGDRKNFKLLKSKYMVSANDYKPTEVVKAKTYHRFSLKAQFIGNYSGKCILISSSAY